LGAGGDALFTAHQMGEKLTDFHDAHLCWMAQFVVVDVALDPVNVGVDGARTHSLEPHGVAHLVKQSWFLLSCLHLRLLLEISD